MPLEPKKDGSHLVPGDEVIFCSGRNNAGRLKDVFEITQSLGLVPLCYEGVGVEVAASQLDKELRSDFYRAKLRIVFFDADADGAICSHWAREELAHVPRSSVLIYASAKIPSEEVRKLSGSTIVVGSSAEFAEDLKGRLQGLMLDP